MKTKISILLLCSILVSCSGSRTVAISNGSTELNDMGYIDPIYSFESNGAQYSKSGQYFIEYTNLALDSILKADSSKYKMDSKLIPNNNKMFRSYLQRELNIALKEIETQGSLVNIMLPENFRIMEGPNLELLMVPFIKPRLRSSGGGYIGHNGLRIVNHPYLYVDSSEVNVFIFDLKQNSIVFFGRVSGKLKGKGYRKKIIDDLNSIYRLMEKE
nr:hypothetical protein [Allomuricauda sp.]